MTTEGGCTTCRHSVHNHYAECSEGDWGDGGGAVVIINYPSECVREGGYCIHV